MKSTSRNSDEDDASIFHVSALSNTAPMISSITLFCKHQTLANQRRRYLVQIMVHEES